MIRNIFVVVVVCAVLTESSALLINRSQRSTDTCGVAKKNLGFIINGQSLQRSFFPWIVALMHTVSEAPQFFCGGTLISKTLVISAAHCILQKNSAEKLLPRDVVALFGAHNLSNPLEYGRVAFSPIEIFIHDNWNPGTTQYDGDISLLIFEKESIQFNLFVQPICLWESPDEPTVTEGIVTGWGQSEDPEKDHEEVPKGIKVLITPNEECLPGEGRLASISSRRTFCAIGLKDGTGVCHGDSGGALFIKVGDLYFLKGIVSSQLTKADGCDVSSNAVYTNVLKFRDWMDKITAAVRKVSCTFELQNLFLFGSHKTCSINQLIDIEAYVLGSEFDITVERFVISENKDVKYLPRNIGEKFPNLKEFFAARSGLTILRDFYFKNMRNLRILELSDNEIASIESKAFEDLISVNRLWLQNNMIETLDRKLLSTMVNLLGISLKDNKIKFLSPATFKITGGKLRLVGLESNVCINGAYTRDMDQLELNIRANCAR